MVRTVFQSSFVVNFDPMYFYVSQKLLFHPMPSWGSRFSSTINAKNPAKNCNKSGSRASKLVEKLLCLGNFHVLHRSTTGKYISNCIWIHPLTKPFDLTKISHTVI
jgi:hypothetical protein